MLTPRGPATVAACAAPPPSPSPRWSPPRPRGRRWPTGSSCRRGRSPGLYELPALRLVGSDLTLSRRRFRQDLSVTLWDLGDLARARARRHPGLPRTGPVVWITGDLQLDHDFGAWTMGQVDLGGDPVDAIDAIPELAGDAVGLAIPYAYVAVDDLGGRVDLRLGRQVRFDEFGGAGLDGVSARVHTGAAIALEAEVGLRVRDRSPLAVLGSDLDGTAGADCREYVEAAAPGQGSWQVIDRSRAPRDTRLGSDRGFCPQREAWQPTVEVAVAADRVAWLDARLAYRRTQSPTVGVIGAVDRLDHPDTGLYPDEAGQAPAWGVDAEHVTANVRARLRPRALAVEPWGYARYSLLHAGLERAGAGVRLARGAHALEPEVARTVPSFDGDSIWSVFAITAAVDARLGYEYRPRGRDLRARARAWVRRYDPDDVDGAGVVAGGAVAGETALPWARVAAELFADDGYGGRRLGGTATARWPVGRRVTLTSTLALVDVADASARADGTTLSALGAAAWHLDDGIAVFATADVSSSPRAALAVRTLAVLDLAFEPDL
ncbi:MAG: hypothetical protein IPL61_16020 [Myxococcales bacterium]|nr:hypothetical protein [Myxococcales bacterium]